MGEATENIILALIGIIPTVVVAAFSIICNNQVIKVEIDNLKKQVEKHNNIIERMYKVEGRVDAIEKELHDNE